MVKRRAQANLVRVTARRIYLDHHAAAPLRDVARAAMLDALAVVGNPDSVHHEGRRRRALLEAARASVAASVSARPASVVFTSGGTEACNLGVLGLAQGVARVVTTRIEHPAVAEAVAALASRGVAVEHIEVTPSGDVDLAPLERVDPKTLIACQWINHETGHVLPVEAIARVARSRGARLFVDATQALGKVPVDAGALGATALALASQKLGGPAGAGALVVEPGAAIHPTQLGGGQERGRRAGTPDVVALAGFGAVAQVVPFLLANMPEVARRRDRIERALLDAGGVTNAPTPTRAASVTSIALSAWRSDWLVAALDAEGLACSSGAACSSGLTTRSKVVAALFPSEPFRAGSTLRVSLGTETTDEEVDHALAILARVLARAT